MAHERLLNGVSEKALCAPTRHAIGYILEESEKKFRILTTYTHNPFVHTLGVPAVVAAPIILAIVSRFYRYLFLRRSSYRYVVVNTSSPQVHR